MFVRRRAALGANNRACWELAPIVCLQGPMASPQPIISPNQSGNVDLLYLTHK